MKKSIYLVQPSYRTMDGTVLKGLPIFNHAINMPMLSACIPDDWEKRTCIEYFEDVDLDPSESVVVLTSPGYDIAHAVELARHFKSLGKILVFGSHMDEMSDQLMSDASDIVYYGYPHPEAMEALLADIHMGRIQREYRWGLGVDFSFDYAVFRGLDLPFVPVMMSTGCKNACAYCCYPPLFAGRYRLRHVERVIDDLRQAALLNKPVSFLDGNLYNNRGYLLRLCEAISEAKLKVPWGGQTTIDIGDDPAVLSALRQANCRLLLFGLETLEPENERQLNKEQYPVAEFEGQITRVQRAGIRAGAYFMFGLDHDTVGSFEKVCQFIDRTRVAVPYLHLLVPIPGTAIYHQLKSEGRLLAEVFGNYLDRSPEFSVPCSRVYYQPLHMSGADVERRFLELNKEVYGLSKIFGRCISWDFRVMLPLLKLNLEARHKYQAMERGRRIRIQKERSTTVNDRSVPSMLEAGHC
jgi:radical SAM superfamily enzyme YgiQ (UPF0313 family)